MNRRLIALVVLAALATACAPTDQGGPSSPTASPSASDQPMETTESSPGSSPESDDVDYGY